MLPKAQPPMAEIAKNDFTEPDVPLKKPDAAPTVMEEKKPKKTPIVPANPIPVADVVAREIPPQPPAPDYSGLAKNLELDLGNVKLKTVRIDPGKFMMGSPEDEVGRDLDEGPMHEVEITKPFYMGIHEVTRGQFRAFVKATGYKTDAETDGRGGKGFITELGRLEGQNYQSNFNWQFVGYAQTDDHPVINVSWNDAMAFCNWLSRQAGKNVDLPTEAEWEFCCRAESKTRFFSGDQELSIEGHGNMRDRSLKKIFSVLNDFFDIDDNYPFTAPVGQFKANIWGLHDMHGNVSEWCKDWVNKDYYKVSPQKDPSGPSQGKFRAMRGGSFITVPRSSRSAFRQGDTPSGRGYSSGFRVVVRLTPQPPEKNNINNSANADSSGFVPLFNSKDLTGFEGDLSRWSVQDGVLTGSTVGNPSKTVNTFLMWTGKVDDFELKCKFRLEGASSNSGIQYRSKQLQGKGDFLIEGYQADMCGLNSMGTLWETRGRQLLARAGQKIIIDTDGARRQVGSMGDAASILGNNFDSGQWHECLIIAKGNHLQHFIDGKQTIDVIDNQESKRALEGILAFELNNNTIAQFKDIQMKKLSPGGISSPDQPPIEPIAKSNMAPTEKVEGNKTNPPSAPLKITPALLKNKFKGKASYDHKTSTLTLVYDFKSPGQLQDFEMDKAKSSVNGGFLLLQPTGRAKHIVQFSEVNVTGVAMVKTMRGGLLSTTGGTRVGLGGKNPDTVYLDSGKGHAPNIVPSKERTGNIPFTLKILPSQATFAYGNYNLTILFPPWKPRAGFVEFLGGEVGYGFAQLAISGKMDTVTEKKHFLPTLSHPPRPLK